MADEDDGGTGRVEASAAREAGRVAGKVALVTGAARGMGEAMARALAAEGATVVLADVLDAEGKEAASDIGGTAAYLHLDVTSEEDWTAGVAEVRDRAGRLDVLVNNAALRIPGTVQDLALDDLMRVIGVNQVGTFLGMRAVVPLMREGGGGSIVNLSSSMAGTHGRPGSIAYTSTKWAIRGMTRSAALDLARHGIRVNAVRPGVIATPMSGGLSGPGSANALAKVNATIPAGRLGRPEEVARMVVFLASDDSSYCTGADFTVDGGWDA